jgi:hypothetical protein
MKINENKAKVAIKETSVHSYDCVKVQVLYLTPVVIANACRVSTIRNNTKLIPSVKLISSQICGARLIIVHARAHHQILN